jgi:hypothetical protein
VRLRVAACLAGVVLTGVGPARADDDGIAEALYREGQRLISTGSIHEACLKFAESERVDPAPGTLLATAACHEKEGKVATAWGEYTEAVTLASRAHETARQEYAHEHAATLERVLYRVTVTLEHPPPGTELKVDARTLGIGALGSAIPLDPGMHRLEVSAPGSETWSRDVDVPPRHGDQRLAVSLAPSVPFAPLPDALAPTTRGQYVWPVTLSATGVAGALAGVGLLLAAHIEGDDAVSSAAVAGNASAYAAASSEHERALTLQTSGLIVGAVGLAMVAVGTVLTVSVATRRGGDRASAHRLRLLAPPFQVAF